MWRMAASMGLIFGALAWSALSIMVIFLIVPSLWEALFGPGAAFGALGALALAVWSSARLVRWADRLLGETDHRPAGPAGQARLAEAEADVPADWRAYNAEIVRSKRWAFYRRTRQFDRLVELEAEGRRPT